MQDDLWGNQVFRRDTYHIYHDESESRPNKGWLLIGLLFIRSVKLDYIRTILSEYRRKEKYYGEVHFCQLPKSFDGQFGGKARLAKHWVLAYENGLFQEANFSILALDRQAKKFERRRFKKGFHAYNRFTAMAIKAGIAWHLGNKTIDEIDLSLITDAKDRNSSPDSSLVDNFETYIPFKTEMDTFIARKGHGKPYPLVRMNHVESKHSHDDDLLQLVDVLLGSVKQAVVNGSTHTTQKALGLIAGSWCRDIRLKPWEQQYKMHRMFNVCGFPDSNGRPYNSVPLVDLANTKELFGSGS